MNNDFENSVWYQRLFDVVKNAFGVQDDEEKAEKVPGHVINALKRGLKLHEEGKSGKGLKPETVAWARRMVNGDFPSRRKIIDASAWFARHDNDVENNARRRDKESPAMVAWLLWGDSGDGKGRAWWDRQREALRENKEFYITKDAEGNYRWFGWVTNKWKDREDDIITDAAHVEFKEFLDENPEYAPEKWTWHTPKTAIKNKADWWDYANGFFVYSGILEEDEVDAHLKDFDFDIGMSHGFFVLEREGRYITKYRTFEVSDLPLDKAANPYTNFMIKEEIKTMFSTQKRQYLVERFGEEAVVDLEKDTEARENRLKELGVDWKEVNEKYEEEIEAKLADRVATASKATVKTILDEVIKSLNLPGLQETLTAMNGRIEELSGVKSRVEALEGDIKHLLETEDERIAKAITPVEPLSWDLRPSQNRSTEVKELSDEVQEEVEKASGSYDWLTGMSPFGGN